MNCIRAQLLTFLSLIVLLMTSLVSQAQEVTHLRTYYDPSTLSGISDVAASADGKYIFTAAYIYSGVSAYKRNSENGELTYLSSISGIVNAFSVEVSPDNRHMWPHLEE